MKNGQLANLNLKELLALEVEVQHAIVARRQQERDEVKAKLLAFAEKSGFTVDELFGKIGRKVNVGSKGKVAPKYRNPQNPAETWSGRGRMPLWIKALTDKGAKREKFLIG